MSPMFQNIFMIIFTFAYFTLSQKSMTIMEFVLSFLFFVLSIMLVHIYEQRRLKYRPVNILLLFPAYIGLFFIQGQLLTQIIQENAIDVTFSIQLGFLLLSIACLLPPIRRLVARLLPINSQNHGHALAISLSLLIFIPLLHQPDLKVGLQEVIDNFDPSSFIFKEWLMLIPTVVISFVGVGLFIKRNWKEACTRLGLVKPQWRHFSWGVLFAMGLLAWGYILIAITSDPALEKLMETYIKVLGQNIWCIITIGLTAGIGEELLCRGLLLPRLGIIYSSLLFAGLHFQYGISVATISVFTHGIAYALIRKYYNTNTAIITHAIYNILIGLMP